ncbi:MAG TPA: hypothetical protein HA263_09110 [Methanoregulaceae archaeon]|nr:hypothetical protein [Methanoregulaceae archaeon]
MSQIIGEAVRDDDGIEVRLAAGPRRGCYRVAAEEVPPLLAGFPAALFAEDAPVGDIVASRSLAVLRGSFRAGLGFLEAGTVCAVVTAAFLIPRAHLAAHYARDDGPISILAGGA